MTIEKYPAEYIRVGDEVIQYHKIDRDVNGNARYVVHFLALGIEHKDYRNGNIPGIKKYRAKWFGGGVVIQSCYLEQDLKWYINHVKAHYAREKLGESIRLINASK